MLPSTHHQTSTAAPNSSMQTSPALGFGDLCRYFYRALREDFEDYTAHNLATLLVECWKRNKYLYSDLEEMFLINQDKELLARELGSTLGDDRESFPEGVSCARLVNWTIDFFTTEPSMTEKLCKYNENMNQTVQAQRIVIGPGVKRDRSPSLNLEVELRPKRKMSKFDSLKPISNYLENLLVSHGLTQHRADLVVLDIAERFVTAGFGWDKVLQYHAKGEDIFIKKLIPHVFMSKDDFPPSITSEIILNRTFEFMEDWKTKLYDMLSFSTIKTMQNKKPADIKHEPIDETPPQLSSNIKQNCDYPNEHNQMDIKHENVKWRPTLLSEQGPSYSSEHSKAEVNVKQAGENASEKQQLGRYRLRNTISKHEGKKRKESSPFESHLQMKYPKASRSPVLIESPSQGIRSRSVSPDRGRLNAVKHQTERGPSRKYIEGEKRNSGIDLKKQQFPEHQKRDIDARIEPVPSSHFSKHGLKDKDGFLSLEDTDGKTTFYHYKEEEEKSRSKMKDIIKSTKISCSSKHLYTGSLVQEVCKKENIIDNEQSNTIKKENILREALKKRIANKNCSDEHLSIKPIKETESDSSQESQQEDKKMTLLEKVNEIIKSCVKLKEEKKVTGSSLLKANDIIEKAKEKEMKLIANAVKVENQIINIDELDMLTPSNGDQVKKKHLEEGELNDSDHENEYHDNGITKEKDSQRTVSIVKKKTSTKTNYDYTSRRRSSSKSSHCSISSSKSSPTSRSSTSLRTRSQTRTQTRSKTRSPKRSEIRQRSYSNTFSRKGKSNPRNRSWSRYKSVSPRHSQSRKRSSPRYTEYRKRQSRSPERKKRTQHWLPVSPCTIQENVTLETCSTMMVTIAPRGDFSFQENIGCMVRITKWTGRDNVGSIYIKPQIVTLDENLDLQIEVENPYPEKKVYLKKHDNIACLFILTSPIPSVMFSSVNSVSADRYESGSKRWFKVTSVVLHKKGTLDRITIQPGRTMKIIATVLGPLKKYVGKEFLVSQIRDGKECPIKSQIRQICENDCIGFDVTNHGRETLVIEKASQAVAHLSVWATVRMEDDVRGGRY